MFNVPKLSIDDADFANIFGSDGHLLCTQETLVSGRQRERVPAGDAPRLLPRATLVH